MKQRLDVEIARRGLAQSRESAQRLIMAGRVRVNSRPAAKPDLRVDPEARIEVVGPVSEYASRGAYKLIAALDHFAIAIVGRNALDVGASNGGFTDVLLRRGVAQVIALDVGYGQLAHRLRTDGRVTVLDRTNIRFVRAQDLPYRPDLIVVDVSFISLKLVFPAVIELISPAADVIALIKPQFEVGKGQIGKGGIVRDEEPMFAAVDAVIGCARVAGLSSAGVIESPITGASGNREFLALFRYGSENVIARRGPAPDR